MGDVTDKNASKAHAHHLSSLISQAREPFDLLPLRILFQPGWGPVT